MKKKKVWRYWCDFCGKGGCRASAMSQHEKHCTMNPQRECRICKYTKQIQKPLDELVAAYSRGGIDELRDAANNCPACMLAAVRKIQGTNPYECDEDGNSPWIGWSYKRENESFWSEVNSEAYNKSIDYGY